MKKIKDQKHFAKREIFREHHHLLSELRSGNREFYFRYLRMNPEGFDHLATLLKNEITKENAKFKKSISTEDLLLLEYHNRMANQQWGKFCRNLTDNL